jgi:hypothetical protein
MGKRIGVSAPAVLVKTGVQDDRSGEDWIM